MTLSQIAKSCRHDTEEGNLWTQIRALNEMPIADCRFKDLLLKINKKELLDYNVVAIKRVDLTAEDEYQPIWNKSLAIYVV